MPTYNQTTSKQRVSALTLLFITALGTFMFISQAAGCLYWHEMVSLTYLYSFKFPLHLCLLGSGVCANQMAFRILQTFQLRLDFISSVTLVIPLSLRFFQRYYIETVSHNSGWPCLAFSYCYSTREGDCKLSGTV